MTDTTTSTLSTSALSPSRDLDAARKAAEKGDVAASRAVHMVQISVGNGAPESHKKGGDRMKTLLFGGLDGIITTFAVVAGAGGGGLSVGVVLIMGFSSLVADALSMGVGDALSSKAEMEVAQREKAREAWELDNYPEGEIKEMVELYVGKGLEQADAELIVNTMAKYKDFFVDVMVKDELGMDPLEEDGSMDHWISGAWCFTSFMIFGSVPLLGYVAFMPATDDKDVLFLISCCLTACALFGLGAAKSKFTVKPWWWSGSEILVMGAFTASAAYLIGWLVEVILAALNVDMH